MITNFHYLGKNTFSENGSVLYQQGPIQLKCFNKVLNLAIFKDSSRQIIQNKESSQGSHIITDSGHFTVLGMEIFHES